MLWIKQEDTIVNDYNPNNIAPQEKLLHNKSLEMDGFTQPIAVTESREDHYEIVDGFHRYQTGKEKAQLKCELKGDLPVTCLGKERQEEV